MTEQKVITVAHEGGEMMNMDLINRFYFEANGEEPVYPESVAHFTRLIVQECARLVNENVHAGGNLGEQLLFEYFGIEL